VTLVPRLLRKKQLEDLAEGEQSRGALGLGALFEVAEGLCVSVSILLLDIVHSPSIYKIRLAGRPPQRADKDACFVNGKQSDA